MQGLKIKIERYVDWVPTLKRECSKDLFDMLFILNDFCFKVLWTALCTSNIFTSRRVHVILSPMQVIRELQNDVIQFAFFNISERTIY